MPKANEQLWTTATGAKIPISELADSHLLNIHRLLASRIVMYGVISKELKKRKLKPHILKTHQISSIKSALDAWEKDMLEAGMSVEDFH